MPVRPRIQRIHGKLQEPEELDRFLEKIIAENMVEEEVKKTFESEDPGRYGAAIFYPRTILEKDGEIIEVVPCQDPVMENLDGEHVVCAYSQIKESPLGDVWELVIRERKGEYMLEIKNGPFIDF